MKITRDSMHAFRDEIAAWSFRRKLRAPWRGLRFGRTNIGGYSFSRHWPHLLCWSWTLQLTPHRKGFPRKWGFSAWRKGFGFQVPWFDVGLSWQGDQWMVATGPYYVKDCIAFIERRIQRAPESGPEVG